MYKQNGVEIFREIISIGKIEKLQNVVEKLLKDEEKVLEFISVSDVSKKQVLKDISELLNKLSKEAFIVSDLLKYDSAFLSFLKNKTLWQIAAKSLSCEEDDVLYHFCNITTKIPYFGPKIFFHRDYPNKYICPKNSSFVRLLIPLEKMSLENGGLEYIPNTHLISDEYARKTKVNEDEVIKEKISINADAGDIIVLNPKLIHGSSMNESDKSRRVFIVQFGVKNEEYLYKHKEYLSYKTFNEL